MSQFTCLRCFTATTADKVADLACATCAKRGEEPIWKGTVTISDSRVNEVPEGRIHTLILPDDKIAVTADDLEALLGDDADAHEIVSDKALEAALELPAKDQDDKTQHILGTLDALVADKSPESEAWKETRMEVAK